MLHLKSGRGSLLNPFARLSRPDTLRGRISLSSDNLTSGRNIGVQRYASTKATASKSSKSLSAWKVAGGITVLCGGALIAGGALYNYNANFRSYLDKNMPAIGKAIQHTGLLTGSSNREVEAQKLDKFPKLPSDSGPLNLNNRIPKDTAQGADVGFNKPLKSAGDSKKPEDAVASLSSFDQTAISAVDLDIAKTVEKEAREVTSKKEAASHDTKNAMLEQESGNWPAPGPSKGSPTAAVSAVDFTGVSSIDLDIAASVEKMADPGKELDQSSDLSKTPVAKDTGLTDEEVEAMVDQTAVELMVQKTMENLRILAQEAINAQQDAAEAIKRHVEQLKVGLAEPQQHGSLKDLSDEVLCTQKTASDSIALAKASQVKVTEEVEKLHSIVKEAELAGTKQVGTAAIEEAAQLSYNVQKSALDMQGSEAGAAVLEEHQKYVQKSRESFRKEIQEIMSGGQDSASMEGTQEKDLWTESVLLAFARKRLEQLGQELAGYQEQEQKRLEQTLKVQRDEDAKLAELKLEQEAQRMASEFATQLKKKEDDWAAQHEANLRQQLRRQAAAYSDHLAEVLRVQAEELGTRHKEDLQEKLKAERDLFETQLRGALARLQGLESVMDSRADVERQYQQSQRLWTACQLLSTAIDKGADEPTPLLTQLTAIHDAAAEDPVVSHVLKSLPEETVTRGVLNEETLRRRFYKVRRWCRRVAMIGENSSSPWTYLLSYLQSFLIFDTFDPKKEGELVDVENLDTFGLLARAEYYVRSGDLELAARLVNQLRGEPRSVARDWLLEARLFLETRQAANFLTAYAAALGAVDSD